MGSRRGFDEISGTADTWPVDYRQDVVFGVTDAEVTRRVENRIDGSLLVEERKRFRSAVNDGIGEAQRVADQLRNDLRLVEGLAQSEFEVMKTRLQGAEYREQVNRAEATSTQISLDTLGQHAVHAASLIAGRDGKIYVLETELAEASSAMMLVENRSSQSLANVGLQLGMANSKLAEA